MGRSMTIQSNVAESYAKLLHDGICWGKIQRLSFYRYVKWQGVETVRLVLFVELCIQVGNGRSRC